MIWFLILMTIGFSVARFLVPVSGRIEKKDIYKNLAHIWVGVLIGIPTGLTLLHHGIIEPSDLWPFVVLPIVFTIVEIVAFIVRRKPVRNGRIYRPNDTVEAMQFTIDSQVELWNFIDRNAGVWGTGTTADPRLHFWQMKANNSGFEEIEVPLGHWVIYQPLNKRYWVMDPVQFTASYEKVEG